MRTSILAIACMLLAKAGHAQNEIQYGIKGGINLASVQYINADNSKARVGWNAGLMVEVPVEDNIVFRPEVQYSSKGFAFNATSTSNKGSVRLNYVAVPLLFGYKPSRKATLLAGPELGFLSKAVSKSQGFTTDLTNSYRHFDIGVDVGAQYALSSGFGVEARYNYGFKDLVNTVIFDNSGNIIGQGKTGANRVLQVGVYLLLSQ